MRPFAHHVGNHLPSTAPNGSVPLQTVGNTSNMMPNLMQIQSQMGYVNPQISIPFDNNNNTNFNTNLGNGFMNFPDVNGLQNGHLGNSILGSAQQIQSNQGFSPNSFGHNLNVLGFPVNGQLSNLGQGNQNQLFGNNGQFGWQNQVQSMNQLGNMPLLNPAQLNALTQLLGCANQVAQAMNPQSAAFLGNPQLGFGQPNGGLQQSNFSQQLPLVSQQLQNVSVPPSNPAALSHPHVQSSNLQGNQGQKQGLHNSNLSHHRNKNFMHQKREASNWRSQKSQDRQIHNPKGKINISNAKEGKGINNAGPNDSANQSKSGKRRSLAMLYTEKEIHQWREERKKNFPSKDNMEKKLAQKQANADAADEDAKLRRQQLKDVLAKQVELGFEVPEIPSHYLLDPEHQAGHGRDKSKVPLNKGRFQNNGRFQNRFNRGGRSDRRDRFAARNGTEHDGSFKKHERLGKRQRLDGDNSSKTPMSTKEPTLLQKLLSTDIKRDNTRLLQAFRFMVINSFFEDWPQKPLNFPKVIVKETGVENDVIEEKPDSFKGELSNNDDDDTSDKSDGENGAPQEEGEITD
ncbi:hypothetical protein BVRB_003530 [Beta vulgaris subsp. vulgaris]|uniref:FMR1-interacting protein 1 conserved domain-containing protein n=1 Tax=Beta vulgaris subsp. vulgaris TaxID=3555 RepID=A0A0J8B4N9_BETVV|nr:uncharacterized protein LOC104883786 isoform X2 [Beta vulgaris subsp. vulgaris]KMS95946.1 hypothetical protein BVRB_003530 [Beta vulgaris subsp. vulgaris]